MGLIVPSHMYVLASICARYDIRLYLWVRIHMKSWTCPRGLFANGFPHRIPTIQGVPSPHSNFPGCFCRWITHLGQCNRQLGTEESRISNPFSLAALRQRLKKERSISKVYSVCGIQIPKLQPQPASPCLYPAFPLDTVPCQLLILRPR